MTAGLLWIGRGRALGDQLAEIDDVDSVGNVHDQVHVVLDHEHGQVELLLDAAR